MSDTADKPKKGKSDEDILSVARSRFTASSSAHSESRQDELEDLRFAAGSPDNNWQWPTEVLSTRTAAGGDMLSARPTLTINHLPQHIKQVTNDQRQHRPAGSVIPANGDADVEVAEIFEGIVRWIEYNSDADVAYDTACENAVTIGEGWFRLLTDYVSPDSFDQDIFIKRIRNSFSVYPDPMMQDPCGADMNWCFITEDLTKDEFEVQYPDAALASSLREAGVGDKSFVGWLGESTIRIAEYFYFDIETVTLNLYSDGNAAFEGSPEDDVYREHYGKPLRSRPSEKKTVKWCKINGYEILERRDWPGEHIPVILVLGNEFEVEGRVYRSGLVRNAKDAQRMYNYHASQEVEMLALAPKAPFIGYAGQFEGYESDWKTANVRNHPYLQVNPEVTDGDGRPVPLPQRAQPPMVQSGIIAAKQGALEDIKATTGQYNASLGQPSNERSGKAILARAHEGDVGTYHYGDNLARAIRWSTRMIVSLIPKIYDTKRVALLIGEDGKTSSAEIDPEQKVPVVEVRDHQNQDIVIKKIYNPSIGRYGTRVVAGPNYTTKRQQALDAMVQILQSNEHLWSVMGDLVVKNMDWPGAQEIAKRLAKTIDPKLMGEDDASPALQQAQQQLQQLTQELQQAHSMLTNVHNSFEAKEYNLKAFEARIKAFDAETKRIAATAQAARAATQDQAIQTPEQIQDVVLGTLDAAAHSGHLPMMEGTVPQSPQEGQGAPPQLDPNKLLAEQSKHALQDKQHAHEMQMAQMQAAQQPEEPPQTEGGQ